MANFYLISFVFCAYFAACIVGNPNNVKQPQSNTDAAGRPFWAARGRRSGGGGGGIGCENFVEDLIPMEDAINPAEDYYFEQKELGTELGGGGQRSKRFHQSLGWKPPAFRFLYPNQDPEYSLRKKNEPSVPFWAARG